MKTTVEIPDTVLEEASKASFKGSGLHPDLAGAPWQKIRDTIYAGRGA